MAESDGDTKLLSPNVKRYTAPSPSLVSFALSSSGAPTANNVPSASNDTDVPKASLASSAVRSKFPPLV